MDGAIYVVRLLEIAIHKITLDDRGRIIWPKFLGEQALPPIDGVLCLFDSTDLRTVSQYPQVLGKEFDLLYWLLTFRSSVYP